MNVNTRMTGIKLFVSAKFANSARSDYFSAGPPDNELFWSLWNVAHAIPHIPSAADFEFGFAGDIREHFRRMQKVKVQDNFLFP